MMIIFKRNLLLLHKGELEFNNRPFVKHRVDNVAIEDEYVAAVNTVKILAPGITTGTTREEITGITGTIITAITI